MYDGVRARHYGCYDHELDAPLVRPDPQQRTVAARARAHILCLAQQGVVSYASGVAIRWAESVDKHGIAHEDALHAIANAIFHEDAFDESRVPGHPRPDLYIGPGRAGRPLLEVMLEAVPPRDLVIFHVMIARDKHLRRMRGDDDG